MIVALELVATLLPALIVLLAYSTFAPEPRQPAGTLARAAFAGALALLPAIVVSLLTPEGLPETAAGGYAERIAFADGHLSDLLRMFVVTGLVEETSKIAVLVFLAWPPAYSEDPAPAAITGLSVGVGFGTAEAWVAALVGQTGTLLRGISSIPFHALATASLAVCFSLRGRLKPHGMVAALIAVAVVHTGYNYTLVHLPFAIPIALIVLAAWATGLRWTVQRL